MVKKKKRMLKCFIIAVCVFFISAILLVSPIFNVKNIRIVGNSYYNDEKIIEIIDIRTNDNWFKKVSQNTKLSIRTILLHRYFEGEDNLKKLCPYIKDVKVALSGFGEYTVTIKERKPVAKVAYLAQYVIIDESGIALDVVEDKDNIILPKINGVTLTNVSLGEPIGMGEEKIEVFCKVYNIINESDINSKEKFYKEQTNRETYDYKAREELYNCIDYMDFGDLDDIKFFLDGRILVYLGKAGSINEHKINYLKEIFFNNIDDKEEGVLNFRTKKNPTYAKRVYAMINNEKVEGKKCY